MRRASRPPLLPYTTLFRSLPSQSDDRLINFSLNKARASAWLVANMINSTPTDKLGRELEILDERSEVHTSELQSQSNTVCRPLLDKKNIPQSAHLPLQPSN